MKDPVPQAGEKSVTIRGREIAVWKRDQVTVRWQKMPIVVTKFADHDFYATELIDTVRARATNPALSQKYDPNLGIGSSKVYDVAKWPTAAAALIHARALALFRSASQGREGVVDLSWASVYRRDDWCMPHSHPRTAVSILYMLDGGDTPGGPDGRFCFGDPRLAVCCREEDGYMSTPCAPPLEPGMMMLFPGQAVHFVTPYRGKRPRITMSWNLNYTAKSGNPLPEGVTRPS